MERTALRRGLAPAWRPARLVQTRAETSVARTLRLQVQRMGQNRPTKLEICRERFRAHSLWAEMNAAWSGVGFAAATAARHGSQYCGRIWLRTICSPIPELITHGPMTKGLARTMIRDYKL